MYFEASDPFSINTKCCAYDYKPRLKKDFLKFIAISY